MVAIRDGKGGGGGGAHVLGFGVWEEGQDWGKRVGHILVPEPHTLPPPPPHTHTLQLSVDLHVCSGVVMLTPCTWTPPWTPALNPCPTNKLKSDPYPKPLP